MPVDIVQVDLGTSNLDRLRIRARVDIPLRMTAAEQSNNSLFEVIFHSVSDSARVETSATAAEPLSRRKIVRRETGLCILFLEFS